MAEPQDQQSSLHHFELTNQKFNETFMTIMALGSMFCGAILMVLSLLGVIQVSNAIGATLVLASSSVSYWLIRRGKVQISAYILVYGSHFLLALLGLVRLHSAEPLDTYAMIIFTCIGAVMISENAAFIIGGSSVLILLIKQVGAPHADMTTEEQWTFVFISAMAVLLVATISFFFTRQARRIQRRHRIRLEGNERLFQQVPSAIQSLSAAANEIARMTKEQKNGVVRQSSAVAETRRTLGSLLESSETIVESSEQSLENSRKTLETAESSANLLNRLTEQTQKIATILETIKELANRSDVLALNASLEGTKAGEAGKGFSLVANQMQKLAENTFHAVDEIKTTTRDIRRASQETQLATEETTKLATTSTEEAQRITLIVGQQKGSVEQVTAAMDDIAEISLAIANGTEQTLSSTDQLEQLAEQLETMVREFEALAKMGEA